MFAENGYIILHNLFPIMTIKRIKHEVKNAFQSAAHGEFCNEPIPDSDFYDLLYTLFEKDFKSYYGAALLANHLMSVHQLGTSQLIVDQLRALGMRQPSICARPLMWFHHPKLAKTTRYHRLPAHQEWSNMQGSQNALVAWLPLVKLTPDMGKLQVIPGSHKQGSLPYHEDDSIDYPFATSSEHYNEADFVEIDAKPGDCVIFSSFLVHRSGVNQSKNVRWTVNFRYNDVGCPKYIERQFYNPFKYVDKRTLGEK